MRRRLSSTDTEPADPSLHMPIPLLVAFLIGASPSAAQADSAQPDAIQTAAVQINSLQASAPRGPWSLTAAYVGELLVRPGGQVGIEYALTPLSWLSLVGRANLGGYVHYRYAVAFYADVELGARATTTGGFIVELLGNAGYLHRFPDGSVYQVSSQGEAVVAPNLGDPTLDPRS